MKKRSGFTLIEAIIYFALFTSFITLVTYIFISVLQLQSQSRIASTLQQDSRFLLSRLAYDIHRADSVTEPLPSQTGSRLNLSIGGAGYTYSVADGMLSLTGPAGTTRLTAPDISTDGFNVSYLQPGTSAGSVTVDFVLRSTDPSSASQSYQTTFTLR